MANNKYGQYQRNSVIISKKIEGELTACLTELGFSNYEIKVINTLYNEGSLKADQLAEMADIPLSRVYDAVESLIRKGFISVSNSRPRIYHAYPPSEASTNYLTMRRKEMEEELEKARMLTREFVEIIQPVFLKRHTQISPENLITQLNSLEDAEAQTAHIIALAQKEICIFTHIFNWYDKVKDELHDAIQRGVKVRILFQSENEEKNKEVLQELKKQGVKWKISPDSNVKTRGTIVDRQHVIFVMWAIEPNTIHPRRIFKPQYSENQGVVNVFCNNFDYLWGRD